MPRRTRRTSQVTPPGRPALALTGAVLLAACGGATEPFADRSPLASCGEVVLGQGERVPDDAWACLDDAFATGAELVATAPTTEGDPIVTSSRVGPGIDGLEILTDASVDRYGADRSSTQLCPGTVTVTAPSAARSSPPLRTATARRNVQPCGCR